MLQSLLLDFGMVLQVNKLVLLKKENLYSRLRKQMVIEVRYSNILHIYYSKVLLHIKLFHRQLLLLVLKLQKTSDTYNEIIFEGMVWLVLVQTNISDNQHPLHKDLMNKVIHHKLIGVLKQQVQLLELQKKRDLRLDHIFGLCYHTQIILLHAIVIVL